ncbi:MAG: cytochrome c biogenesis CcdA family protein [Saccharofermentanales bacterium]
MDYILSFLEGIITFISPCILPMFPIYLSYFAGNNSTGAKNKTLTNALGFTLGFTMVFVTLGAFAGTIGGFLREYRTFVNIFTGSIIVIFGLYFIGLIKIPVLDQNRHFEFKNKNKELGFISSIIFGIVFSIGWTPCVGVFLGSALMLAASAGGSFKGILLLLVYSIGLALPFLISAILIDKLKSTFDFIKRNYKKITLISGIILIIIGIMMIFGLMGYIYRIIGF